MTAITLSSAELTQVGILGVMRRISALENKRKPKRGIKPETEWQADIQGMVGEYVLAKYFDKFWTPVVGKLDTNIGDVHGYQVRATPWRNGHLIINEDDPPKDIYILITGENTVGFTWWVRGWLVGGDGKREEWWGSKQKNRYAYFVPQAELNEMSDLITF